MAELSPPGPIALVVPNALTGLRLLIALAFPWIEPEWRFGAVLIAGATDAVDGLLARRLGAITWFGALLDGVADKAFAVIVLGVLAAGGSVPIWGLGPLLARDLVVAMIYVYVASRRKWGEFRSVTPRLPGKITTLLLFALGAAVLGWPEAGRWLLYPAMASSVWAGADYLVVFSRALRDEAHGNPSLPRPAEPASRDGLH